MQMRAFVALTRSANAVIGSAGGKQSNKQPERFLPLYTLTDQAFSSPIVQSNKAAEHTAEATLKLQWTFHAVNLL